MYTYVIIDTDHKLSDITLAAFDVSDLVILVTSQDVPSISRMQKFLDLAPHINLDMGRTLIVINPFDKRIGITPEKLSQSFKKEISVIIPLERETVIPSINRGVPFMLQKETQAKPVARAIANMAKSIKEQLALLEKASAGS
jgi:pilus assembly protein CpaE